MCVHLLFLLNYCFVLLSRKQQKSPIRHHLHGSVGYVVMVIHIIIFIDDPYRNMLMETYTLDDPTGPASIYMLVSNKDNYFNLWLQIVVVQNFHNFVFTWSLYEHYIYKNNLKPSCCQFIFSICLDVKCCLAVRMVQSLLGTLLLFWLMQLSIRIW